MPLLSAVNQSRTLSPALPVRNTVLNSHGIAFRQGQFSLVAAAPGVGKSVVATNLSVFTGVPTLFFSADSDEWTVRQRALAILTSTQLDDIERNLQNDAWNAHYAKKLKKSDHIDWCFSSDIDVEFIVLRLQAYAELRGEYPQLIVVDNLVNTVVDQDNEYTELRGTCRELQRIARYTKAHVLGLHHVNGAKEDGDKPITLGDLLGKLGKIPELVMGLSRDSEESLTVTVPKNRGGRAGMSFPLAINYHTALAGGFSYAA